MLEFDPWEKAKECVRALQISMDPHQKAVLTSLKEMWIALANEQRFVSPEHLAHEVEAIDRLHVSLTEMSGRTRH
jgi:hypothetical protein